MKIARIRRMANSFKFAIFVLVFLTAQAGSIARAATTFVPAEQPSIQAAIDAASSGDAIVVAPGTYYEAIDFLGKAITLRSAGGPTVTVIDGSGANGSVVQCVSGEGPDTILQGFTITGGNANIGGGMLNVGSSPTVIDSVFVANHADDRGGGMYNRKGNPIIIGTTFRQNTSGEMGGGMFNIRSSPTVTGSLFTENSSNKGAGMRNYIDSHPTVTNSVFSYNVAGAEGGGMDNRKNSNPLVRACEFIGNTAGSGGGGMHNYVGRAVSTGDPIIMDSLFAGNAAPTGAAMRNNDVSPSIYNSTFSHNIGAAISSRNGSVPLIVNSILWDNSGGSFAGATSGLSIVSYSIVAGGFSGPGNADFDPLFESPAGPDGNVATLDDNNYRLSSVSPAIDAGLNDSNLSTTDLDGGPRIDGGIVDMGAYEVAAACGVDDGVDFDQDGYTTCGGDCNDGDGTINPWAVELCDGIDNNCSGLTDEGFDADGDGYTTCGGDCNDGDATVNPAATELCGDGLDNNCDGLIDTADAVCAVGNGDGIHVGDLDGVSRKLPRGRWEVVIEISVHGFDHAAIGGATVTGMFRQGAVAVGPLDCITDGAGTCSIASGQLPSKHGSVIFAVDGLDYGSEVSDLLQSHDPDGDSVGNSISVSK